MPALNLTVVVATLVATQAPPDSVPLYANLGRLHHAITTKVPRAQQYFDQGMILAYGFNHEEAINSFRYAARLDPDCAMCYWGVAFALGPNINLPMDTSAIRPAWDAMQAAQQRAPRASDTDRAYIAALARRYSTAAGTDRARLDSAYAVAARDLAGKYPNDPDAQTLFADALMNLAPWNYWENGKPRPGTEKIVSTLERGLANHADHMGLCHFYIHAVEASFQPERAVKCAEGLAQLAPGAGHLVHMPAHIYMRVGRYADAVEANEHASHTDESFFSERHPAGFYVIYWAHNLHFLWSAAQMEGRSAVAIQAARDLVTKAFPPALAEQIAPLEYLSPTVYLALVRFGRWQDILNEPVIPPGLRFANAIRHFARGRALTAIGQRAGATAQLDSLKAILAQTPADQMQGFQKATDILGIAEHVLMGEMAAAQGDVPGATQHLGEAIRIEDHLAYDEPPPWFLPVRHSLGAVLLASKRPAEAEQVYQDDLLRNPENGWSLFGLGQALRAQGKTAEVAAVEVRFKKAWARADVTLTASRF